MSAESKVTGINLLALWKPVQAQFDTFSQRQRSSPVREIVSDRKCMPGGWVSVSPSDEMVYAIHGVEIASARDSVGRDEERIGVTQIERASCRERV